MSAPATRADRRELRYWTGVGERRPCYEGVAGKDEICRWISGLLVRVRRELAGGSSPLLGGAGEGGEGWRRSGGKSGVSLVRGLRAVPEANLLSARGGASASCCMQSAGDRKGTERAAQSTERVRPRGVGVRAPLRKAENVGKGVAENWVGGGAQGVGTIRWSCSGVVCLVANRHRSTASLRAAATASLRRAAPRTTPSTSLRTGG